MSEAPRRVLVGVDVGGTFTDAVGVCDGRLLTAKRPTSAHQDDAVMAVVRDVLRAAAASAGDVEALGHGTTTGTNALLERRGARTAFVTTSGFEHVLHLARQNRAQLYRPCAPSPSPLVALGDCHGVDERMGVDGVVRPLEEASVRRLVERLQADGIESVALSLLHSYRDAAHERAVEAIVRRALDDVHVSASHELAPEFREYERASTVAADAYLGPVMSAYLDRLGRRARESGLPEPGIVRSSGGLARPADVVRHPAWALLSGPAAGAAGAAIVGRRAGASDLLTLDMGGTSCDVGVVGPEGVERAAEGSIDGLPVRLPMLDLVTVGAGGGSYAWLDGGGALRVGPESAGARPGPACYGRGGTRPTVTDAHALLGHLPDQLAGGVAVDRRVAAASLAPLAQSLGLPIADCARGVLRVAEAELVRAVRLVTVERGRDPRVLALLAFGGAGPMHVCGVADQLEIRRALVPAAAGVLSALGAALGEHRVDLARSVLTTAGRAGARALEQTFAELERRARAELRDGTARCERSVDVRLRGQAFELTVGYDGLEAALAAFHDQHESRYGFADRGGEVELVAARVGLRVPRADPGGSPPVATRVVRGPDRVELGGATCLVEDGWQGRVAADGLLDLRRTA